MQAVGPRVRFLQATPHDAPTKKVVLRPREYYRVTPAPLI